LTKAPLGHKKRVYGSGAEPSSLAVRFEKSISDMSESGGGGGGGEIEQRIKL